MKTLFSTGTSFNNTLSSAVKNEETKRPKMTIVNRIFLTLVAAVLMIGATCSCDRNVASGCGTWPMANNRTAKNFKSESRTNIYKNNKQFSSYKKYN